MPHERQMRVEKRASKLGHDVIPGEVEGSRENWLFEAISESYVPLCK